MLWEIRAAHGWLLGPEGGLWPPGQQPRGELQGTAWAAGPARRTGSAQVGVRGRVRARSGQPCTELPGTRQAAAHLCGEKVERRSKPGLRQRRSSAVPSLRAHSVSSQEHRLAPCLALSGTWGFGTITPLASPSLFHTAIDPPSPSSLSPNRRFA